MLFDNNIFTSHKNTFKQPNKLQYTQLLIFT